jgi:hypothetical protein
MGLFVLILAVMILAWFTTKASNPNSGAEPVLSEAF